MGPGQSRGEQQITLEMWVPGGPLARFLGAFFPHSHLNLRIQIHVTAKP